MEEKFLKCPNCNHETFIEIAWEYTMLRGVFIGTDGKGEYGFADRTVSFGNQAPKIDYYECQDCCRQYRIVAGKLYGTEKDVLLYDSIPVRADAHSDDRVVECAFFANPWMANASDDEVLALARTGWGGSQEADAVAILMAEIESDVAEIFRYLELVNGKGRDNIGFECHIDEEDAIRWLNKNRSGLCQRMADEGLAFLPDDAGVKAA